MKQTGIHILDFNDKIIDYISRDDGALLNAVMSINADEKSETFDFTVLNERADNLRERNRIIAQDSNGLYREFIVTHVVDNFDGTTEIESNASYLEDIGSSKPIKPGKYSAYSTTQALNETLRNTGWELSDDTEHGGMRTTSWTSYVTPYELINQLCTTYSMVADYYIELSSHTVEHRYVSLKKPVSLFKGKEITKGKDLTGMTRTVDMSEVRTALYAVGPEKEKGERLEKIVTDDDAQMQFGLPGRYLWSVYEPESDDENMTLERLTTLAKTELNKRNKSAISYEIGSTDIHKFYKDITISLHDTVRVKDRDFRPPLYLDAEVIAIDYDLLNDESTYKFGNVVEYEESKLRDAFNKRFDAINKKLNDSITNINTIVNDTIAGELEYYERKIIKSNTSPENPVNDMLWYDTSNPDVAVLRRYWNGKWITQTADDVEKIGGLRREQVMYRDLNNSFINLTIQHSNLQNDVYDVLNSEYLVEDDLKANLNQALSDVDSVYQNIKTNLDSMDEDTATIGKLVDTQTLFTVYREKLQTLYKCVTDAKVSIDKRLKLLQSQYTDEKFNDAMDKIAQTLPNGRWDSENQQLYADIPNEQELSNLKQTLQDYYDGNVKKLEGRLNNSIDSKVKVAKEEISTSVKSVESKVDGLNIGTKNLLLNTEERSDSIINDTHAYITYFLTHPLEVGEEYTISSEVYATSSEQSGKITIRGYFPDNGLINVPIIDNKIKLTFKAKVPSERILLYKDIAGQSSNKLDTTFKNTILVKGNKTGDYAPAPEDLKQDFLNTAEENTENALKPITTRVKTNETNISELDKQISLMAKSDDVEQKLKGVDGRLTPLETTVKSNKATLDILPTQIDSKVSKQDYKTDQNNIVQRLDNADSERKQLSNEITDKVTITKFESGISEVKQESQNYAKNQANIAQQNAEKSAKEYTDAQDNLQLINAKAYADGKVTKEEERAIQDAKNRLEEAKTHADKTAEIAKQESQNYTNDEINNLDIGSENLLLDSESRSDGANTSTHSYIRYYLAHPLEIGKTYTLKANIVTTDERQSGKTSVYPFYPNGIRDTVDIKGGKIIHTFIAKAESTQFLIYKDVAGQSNVDLNVTIEKAILVEGDKVTGWAPANEDVKSDIQQAETNAKNYTDEYKRSNDIAMTKLETSITQNGDKIALKVDEQKFNASRKTLSQVISEISATTKGINLSYDENGNIQSYTMDRNGIQLRGDKVDITVNKDFNVMANRVNDKVGKDEIINRLNLSPEGLDIDVNKVGIRGGDSTNYIYLSQDKIEMAGTFQRTFRGNTQKDNVFMRAQGGFLRFRNNNQNRSLYYSDFGISTYIDGDSSEASGTLQFFDYTYSPTNSVRGVTLNSAGGAIALNSERNRIVLDANATVNIESETSSVYIRPMKNNRAGTNEFRFWTKLNDSVADTDGVLSYGTITELVEKAPASYSFGSGIRFDKSPKSRYIYATDKDGNIGTGDFYARNLLGDWWAKNNNLYALVDPKEGKLRITDYNGYNNGSPKYKDLQCDDIQANSVRVNTGQNFYIGVSTNELWVTNNLRYNGGNTGFKPVRASDFIKASSAEFKHDIKKWDYDALNVISNELQLYSYKYNDDEKQTIHHGPVIGDGYDIPVEFVFNSGVNTNEMLSWALRAIQQLNEKINKLEEQLNEQQITS